MQEATKGAAEVPLSVLERSLEVLALAEATVRQGNPNSASDAGVAALCARTCAEGAYLNVRINLKSLIDAAWVAKTKEKAEESAEARRGAGRRHSRGGGGEDRLSGSRRPPRPLAPGLG